MKPAKIIVDSAIRVPMDKLPSKAVDALKLAFTYDNPEYHLKRMLKIRGWWNEKQDVGTWGEKGSTLIIPRGELSKVREVLEEHDVPFRLADRRHEGGYVTYFPDYKGPPLHYYQEEGIAQAIKKENCIIRLPTGTGKSLMAIAFAAQVKLNCLVILPTVGLFTQWCQDARENLKMNPKDLGIIHRKKRILRPITAAVQGTLASKGIDDEMKDYFGVVILDECFTSETPILMEDGTLKCIEDVREGDRTALGGIVRAKMSRPYVGELFVVGDALTTREHPIATQRGWVSASDICCETDLLWYDPLHEERKSVFRVRTTDENRQQAFGAHQVSSEDCSRGSGRVEQGIGWCAGRMEQRPHARRPESGFLCEEAARSSTRRSERTSQSVFQRPEEQEEARESSFLGATREILASRGKKGIPSTNSQADRSGENSSLWGTLAWQWGNSDQGRDADAARTSSGGLRFSVCSEDWNVSSSLQNRSRSSACQSSRRIGWWKSRSFSQGKRSTQDRFPRVGWLAGAALPGAVRLSRGRAKVSSCRQIAATCKVFNLETEKHVYVAGGVLVHNCQKAAARTVYQVIQPFPARYRVGISADERRKDKKEFLTNGLFGKVAYEKKRKELEDEGYIVNVEIRVVPTRFEADWYGLPEHDREIDFPRLVDEMVADRKRTRKGLQVAYDEIAAGEQVIMLSHRVEHCTYIDREFVKRGIASGFFIGDHEKEFEKTRAGIKDGSIRVGVGTYMALGVGVNLPAVSVGVAMTPIAGNQFNFNQVRGRLNRKNKGKASARLYVLWDKYVYPSHLKNMLAWNPTVTVQHHDQWVDGRWYQKNVLI